MSSSILGRSSFIPQKSAGKFGLLPKFSKAQNEMRGYFLQDDGHFQGRKASCFAR